MPADAWGIEDAYESASGGAREISPGTRAAFRAAIGDPASIAETPIVLTRGTRTLLPRGTLHLERGGTIPVAGAAPGDLPLGYHTLEPAGGTAPRRVVVAPPRCFLPDALRTWGWTAQVYAARSRASWGIGDLADLRRLARWSAGLGAGVLMVNPLLADTPLPPQEPSPYHPSSRRYRNPLYLRIEEVPGSREAALDLESLAAAGRALNRERRIDRDAVLALKLEALDHLWSRFGAHPELDRYTADQGPALEQFAAFCALSERHGRDWRRWPPEYRRPESPAVARFATHEAGRVRFHAWLQWLLDAQLARAGAEIAILQDLPVGVARGGADAWAWQDVLAFDVSVGAPPDPFSAEGQNWGFPPFVPHRLRDAGYEPFVQMLRAGLRHAGALRIDHVMGLFRLFWIPEGAPASDGGYVRFPADDLLALVALESQRARAFIVGEDLGTVGAGVREKLAERAILSYRLLWFESDPPARFPALALSAVTTHDLPTIAGIWSGAELRFARAHRRATDEPTLLQMYERLREASVLDPGVPVDAVIEATYRALARAPSAVVMAALDDALAVEERPNMPWSTAGEWPNWCLALPEPLDSLEAAALPRRIAAALARGPAGGCAGA